MPADTEQRGHGFGTLPVFLAGISTILGAIMFLRFGYAVGHVGFFGVLLIIILGHMVTIPTAFALAEIATNRKVEGGGEYFIISRSFGTTIGSVIGLSLYLSQAISVAFYMIAFAEAFRPIVPQIEALIGMGFDPRMVSIPATILLLLLVLYKGADMGVKALYVVVATLIASLILFFLGGPVDGYEFEFADVEPVENADSFFIVFAICFPAFTGMTAGVGLSGDLKNPRKSIPMGTIAATFVGFLVYIFIVAKLTMSAPPEMLAEDQLVMSQIALWGPIIPIGLACATLSSAIGSVLVAPRTLQAIGGDRCLPSRKLSDWLSAGVGDQNEPRNTTLVTGALALMIVFLGNVDFVARLISMFFMVTYGSLCAISFLEHFAARPSYRPSFKSRWWMSLFGAIMCFLMMFQMDPVFAILALLMMTGLYVIMSRMGEGEGDDLAEMFKGVMTQAARFLQIQVQRNQKDEVGLHEWRPSVIMVNSRTFDRRAPLELLRWVCSRYGFGTYLHFVPGHLDADAYEKRKEIKHKLINMAHMQQSAVYMDTIVSPSIISALAQSLQVPGVSGLSNNAVMFEFSRHDDDPVVEELVDSVLFASNTDMALMILRHGDFHFGERRNIHIWITWNDRENANLMILLSYILLAHPQWSDAEISVFAALPGAEVAREKDEFLAFIEEGRVPIPHKNIQFHAADDKDSYRALVSNLSSDADLVIMGLSLDTLRDERKKALERHPTLRDVLFIRAPQSIDLD